MDTKPNPESDSPDTDTRIATKVSGADQSNDSAKRLAPTLAGDATDYHAERFARYLPDVSSVTRWK